MAKDKADKPLADWEREKIDRNQDRAADWPFEIKVETKKQAIFVSTHTATAEGYAKVVTGRTAGGKAHGEPYAERNRWLRKRATEYRAQNSTLSKVEIADRIVEGPLKKQLNIFDQDARESANLHLYADAAWCKKEKKIWDIKPRTVRRIIGKK